ncbi:hypothetical protein Tdes44962_MAKER00114 [Teratosphaeria destructans]|uniref:Uncharacterized protein n=1 Tax=Teratosphaeria destructans TaxID=418781 RepID=A0A9W7T3T3_9PEZI|nr:hypothetical protein Tdes44962_MAKER00114 [Teratosphaeria destructans]
MANTEKREAPDAPQASPSPKKPKTTPEKATEAKGKDKKSTDSEAARKEMLIKEYMMLKEQEAKDVEQIEKLTKALAVMNLGKRFNESSQPAEVGWGLEELGGSERAAFKMARLMMSGKPADVAAAVSDNVGPSFMARRDRRGG